MKYYTNIGPISNLVKRKLVLCGPFCVLDLKFRAKHLFTHRLSMFMNNPNKSNGFISDFFQIMGKYKIAHVLLNMYAVAVFPH